MRISAIKEGDYLRILSASGPIPENTPITLIYAGPDPWQNAQLETIFREEENWGDSLDPLCLPKLSKGAPTSPNAVKVTALPPAPSH